MNKTTAVSFLIVALAIVAGIVIMTKKPAVAPTTDDTQATETHEVDAQPNDNGMETGDTATTTGTSVDIGITAGTHKTFVVDGDNFKFVPKTMTVKKGDTVTITFKNTGGTHDLRIDEFGVATPQIRGGESATVTFVADKAGSFEYYCSVGTHRQMGMVGTLTVE